MPEAIALFFSYSHRDEPLRDKLAEHLKILERQGVISSWHDRQIGAGTEWATEIETNLNQADIILLLISASFLSSDYCWGIELQRAMERHESGSACVIPVILRPVDWSGAPFGKLQAFPKDAKPITRWDDQDEAMMNVAQGIRAAAERLKTLRQQQRVTEGGIAPSAQDPTTQQIRQSGQGESHYRDEVQHCFCEDGGMISPVSRVYLDGLRNSLKLSVEQAEAIEQDTLRPYQTYAQTLSAMLQQQYPLTPSAQTLLERLQKTLNLNDEEVKTLSDRVIAEVAPQPSDDDDLTSERGIDYTQLRGFLRAGHWEKADQETYRVMTQLVGKSQKSWLTSHDLFTFPCIDLRTIDRLWVKYSNDKFGFSVQKQIYVECGAQLDGNYPGDDIWYKFCECVGWRVNGKNVSHADLKKNPLFSFPGELPTLSVLGVKRGGGFIFSRIETCKL
ncbi:MAG: GUN4 domain-containing protein [Oculatellaceae cyanobacterium bins.114]|nr:GUN4 domain-containing protein [Oculatellaceae cyanobacterium bins.114]